MSYIKEKALSLLDIICIRCGWIVGSFAVLYYFPAGIAGGFTTSVLWVWLAGGITLLLLATVDHMTCGEKKPIRLPIYILRYCICFCVVWFFVVQLLVVSAMNASAPPSVDVLLILGAQVKGEEPGIALSERLASAYAYMEENPATAAVLCGGKGPGEDITEAECMYRYLTERGISPERLILEDRSTSTSENVRFARALIADQNASAAVLTSHFHVWRSVHLAKACGWTNVYGAAAPFSPILTPHYMAREFLTITTDFLRGNFDTRSIPETKGSA